MSDLIEAAWNAGYSVELPGGVTLAPGDTHLVSAGEAKASENWRPVKAPKDAPKPAQTTDTEADA